MLELRNVHILACLTATWLAASGCSSSGHSGEKYYLIAANVKLPYWQNAADGLNRAASDLKLEAEMVGPDTYDANAEKEEFARVVARKPAGILISVANPAVLSSDINSAIAAGIPVITLDSDAPDSQRLMFIGTNNYQAGLTGGRLLAKQLNGKGSVVVYTIPGQANLEERLRGYQDAVAGSQISFVEKVDVHGNATLAFDKTAEMIDAGKLKPDAFVCLVSTACKEVADVLTRKNVTGKTIIAMDTEAGTLEWIEKGTIVATIAQKPYTMGYYGLHALDDLHHHAPSPLAGNWSQNLRSPVPANIDTGATLVDKSNLAQVRDTKK